MCAYKNEDRSPDFYGIYHPWKYIDQRQYDDMQYCSRHSFYREIYEFLEKAFPDEIKQYEKKEVLNHIEQSQKIAQKQGYGIDDENITFYWAVLSFMGGLEFYKIEEVQVTLGNKEVRSDAKLADLVYFSGIEIDNGYLTKLGTHLTISLHYDDGRILEIGKWQF